MASSLLIAFLVAAVVGGATTAYIWLAHRTRLESSAGLKILAGMRWREFSQLVVEALRARGFEAESPEATAHRGQQSDIILSREGRTWLLGCKQGMDYRITPASVVEFSRAMRLNGTPAGFMATPGTVEADALGQAGSAVELIGGAALWPMVKPLLPDSVRTSVSAESHALTVRYVVLGWIAALALGFGAFWLMPKAADQGEPAKSAVSPSNPPRGKARSDTAAVLAPAPLSEEEQRELVMKSVSNLPGIDRAIWTTRSTLLIQLADDSDIDHFKSICSVVERYDDLRASRLQLQPASGSRRDVRFLQCKAY